MNFVAVCKGILYVLLNHLPWAVRLIAFLYPFEDKGEHTLLRSVFWLAVGVGTPAFIILLWAIAPLASLPVIITVSMIAYLFVGMLARLDIWLAFSISLAGNHTA